MNILDLGRGPVVVLLHGTASAARDWQPVVDRLVATHRLLVFDQPGYGGSPPDEPTTIARLDDAIADHVRDRAGPRVAAIVGASAGAYRAFDLVARHRLDTEVVISLGGLANLDDAGRAAHRD